jgi:hypothetical protein
MVGCGWLVSSFASWSSQGLGFGTAFEADGGAFAFQLVETERVIYLEPTGPNPLHHRDDFRRPALRHGSLNSIFQVAFCLPA